MRRNKNIFTKLGAGLVAASLIIGSIRLDVLAEEAKLLVSENIVMAEENSPAANVDEISAQESGPDDCPQEQFLSEEVPTEMPDTGEYDIVQAESEETRSTQIESEASQLIEAESENVQSDEESEEVQSEESESENNESEEAQSEEENEVKSLEEATAKEFNESVTVDNIVITVTAEKGVFPEGSTVSARKAQKLEEELAEDVISKVRDADKNVAASYTFDIKVFDKEGKEIQPDNKKGSVNVSFKLKEIANVNLDTEVYHIEGELSDSVSDSTLSASLSEGEREKIIQESDFSASELSVSDTGEKSDADEITVKTEGFSYYTVEFTYDNKQFVLDGDTKTELTGILSAVDLDYSAGISEVKSSDENLFMAYREGGKWYVQAVSAFDTKETLTVTIGGVSYVIEVTDDNGTNVASFTINGTTTNYSSLSAAVAASNGSAGDGTIDVLADTSVDSIKFSKDVTFKLNGHKVTVTSYTTGNAAVRVESNVTISGPGEIQSNTGDVVIDAIAMSTCRLNGGIKVYSAKSSTSGDERIVVSRTGATVYIDDATVTAINTTPSQGVAILVSWNGDIYIYGGEFICKRLIFGHQLTQFI